MTHTAPQHIKNADLSSAFDATTARADFPIFANNPGAIYLDTAASAQKPQVVIDSFVETFSTHYANIHRGLYGFSQTTTARFEAARQKVARFINAPSSNGVIFTRSATEAINLVASSWGTANLQAGGDEIVITALEHHANIVPWQLIAQKTGARLVVAPMNDDGAVTADNVIACMNSATKMVAISAMSNVLGTILPVRDIVAAARERGIATLIDGCQSVLHVVTDVQDLDCDFFAFSGHKLYGPTGIGVLYGREELLNAMPPYQGGGDMIDTVCTTRGTTFKNAPARFEAGTPPIAEAIALGMAVNYLTNLGMDNIAAHEHDLHLYAEDRLRTVPGLRLWGQAPDRASILAFTIENCPPSDIAMILDQKNICVRVGHHCAMPLLDRLGVTALVRASIGLYTTRDDIDALVSGLQTAQRLLG